MDANKDSAEECIRLARARLREGKIEAAKKCLARGLRLYPNVNYKGLEPLLHSHTPSPPQTPNAEPRRRSLSRGRSAKHPSKDKDTNATSEFPKAQVDAIRKVLSCKDYYAILGVSKDSSDDDIKKAYKSLALKFHPDKNKAYGATEAFKKIGTAASVLTDPDKRRKYDQYGTAEDRPSLNHGHGDTVYFETQGFDEVYQMFFGSSFPFSNVYRHQRQRPTHQAREQERDGNFFVYIQLLPLLVLFGLSFFSGFFVKDPYYNLSRTDKYSVERVTNNYRVSYYVKPSFSNDFDGSLHALERQVEEEFTSNLRYRCYREKEHRENLLFRARYYGDDEGFRRASKTNMPSCDRLHEIVTR